MLGERQEALLGQERELLSRLRKTLATFSDTLPGDLRTLDEALVHLDELFLLVIAGEFNSGKSSFINALIGENVLAEGVTPTTDRINMLRYGDQASERRATSSCSSAHYPGRHAARHQHRRYAGHQRRHPPA